ncbi:LutB/LldF family L-lactate oxidation iron-sulfur protein [Acidicapsa dinghuensis]|uniref:LutB/LldF family L-lactate oxidation iron-sulfur protein n=1 Tax=Acidicapsa dinghuensis TaxID=2218256 RepID=A0ABW1EHH3_9BACT|nr:LutB/LldF family L-lactate oxidation iron-sulfur protein [Acidicapsa dinghuensis]
MNAPHQQPHQWHQHEFPEAAREMLENSQTRRNVQHATTVIQDKRNRVVGELPEWQDLREAGSQVRAHALRHLDHYLLQFEENCTRAGGHVHWASDAADARRIMLELIQRHQAKEVIKIKTMTSEEIGLNAHLEAHGVRPIETDLAELIIQLGKDRPSHFVVPALHKNRQQVREIFQREMHLPELGEQPVDLATAARNYLREKYLRIKVAVSGANFLIADTGGVCILESEGNGRMCLTLPDVLISLVGIEKVIPSYRDLEIFLQTVPRSATGERMNPYNSTWSGVTPGDGPKEFHVVLLDNGRSPILADKEAQQTLKCVRCAACLNACPVYHQTGGHAYESVYAGPIGAILTPQLLAMKEGRSLPYASSLCGACYEVCPVKINIPEVLIHLRGKVVQEDQKTLSGKLGLWNIGMQAAAFTLADSGRLSMAAHLAQVAQKPLVSKNGFISWMPGMLSGWTQTRDLKAIPEQSFRDWWAQEHSTQKPKEKANG